MGCHALLQGIFSTQGSNPGLPHCRQILYCLSYWEALCWPWANNVSLCILWGQPIIPFPRPFQGDLPNPGIEPTSLKSPALAGVFFTTSTTPEAPLYSLPHWNLTTTLWLSPFPEEIKRHTKAGSLTSCPINDQSWMVLKWNTVLLHCFVVISWSDYVSHLCSHRKGPNKPLLNERI